MDSEERAARPMRQPPHPGAILRRQILPQLEASGLSKAALASALGIARQSLYDLLNEKRAVTPEVAVRLGRFLGNTPQFWLNLQANHDVWRIEQSPEIRVIERYVETIR